ncbi:MAG: hypothetical protein ACPGJS_05850, partial [Flammeovirgaceae bacterium]
KNKLSKVYYSLLSPSILEIEIPQEKFADCANCHHCISSNNPLYHTKCCTYHPVLPNYMVGAILSEERTHLTEGKRRTRAIIQQKLGVTPYGIIPPVKHDTLYRAEVKEKFVTPVSAEVADQLRCPYYQQGSCTIWSHRTELCSTFFCITTSGKAGKQFWNVFTKYFRAIEHKLSLHALLELGYSVAAIQTRPIDAMELKLDNEAGEFNQALYQELWQAWEGREEAFYIACYEAVKKLNPADVENMLGLEEQVLAKKVALQAERSMSSQLPDLLELVPHDDLLNNVSQEVYTIVTQDETIQFSALQYLFMKSFDGKTSTYDVLRRAYAAHLPINQLVVRFLNAGLLKEVSTTN